MNSFQFFFFPEHCVLCGGSPRTSLQPSPHTPTDWLQVLPPHYCHLQRPPASASRCHHQPPSRSASQ
ncbi:hypothetical protein E2C01_051659 [Portunus trituberculatus]|uniref:Uncharacterized protein n=1 Tax=Portunus trituberculatus TaxID=210409 RepID=A0A5B7GMD7_PORTR|nr:hypothetical protein [Portunus trituberculatus]